MMSGKGDLDKRSAERSARNAVVSLEMLEESCDAPVYEGVEELHAEVKHRR